MKVWLPAIRGGSGTDVFTRRLAAALQCRGVETNITWFPSLYQLFPFLLRRVSPPPGTAIIHANSWNAFAFKREKIPLVVTEHLNVFDPLYRPYKNFAQWLHHEALIRRFVLASFRAASAITAVSGFTASSLSKTLRVQAQAIPNWIDTETFSPPRQDKEPNHRPFRLLFVGNLSRRKGADLLASIMRQLGAEFELYFTSGLRDVEIGDAAQNMVPLGRLAKDTDLVTAYHKSDALLFPSRFEGLPIAPLEAMACGRPVIASNNSSLSEIVQDGASGILCPTDDISSFVNACQKLAAEPETRLEYGRAARSRVEQLFSEEAVVPRYIALYRRLLQDF